MRRLSWKPINFARWNSLAMVLGERGSETSSGLGHAIVGMKVAWERLGVDLDQLFQPSGPPGSHAAHHYHGPSDPRVRQEVLAAASADYETSLMYLDVGLQLSVEGLHETGGLPYNDWRKLVRAAERQDAGLSTTARDHILYLQRTPLYVRNDAVVHPRSLLPMIGFDNVGNISIVRLSSVEPSASELTQLDELLHLVRIEISPHAVVGRDITPRMALNWLGAVSFAVEDWALLNRLRETFGFLLPGAYEIGPMVDAMVDDFVEAASEGEFSRVAFAAGPTSARPGTADVDAAPPMPSRSTEAELASRIEEGITAGKAGDHERAATIFRQCAIGDPEDGVAQFLLGQELLALDQLDEALEYLYRAQAIGGAEGDAVRSKLITAHFNLGVRCFGSHQFSDAAAQYRRVHELAPSDVEAQRHLMEALARVGVFDEALGQAAVLVRDHGDDPEVQHDVALVLHLADNNEQALHHVEVALRLRPGWDRARELRNLLSSARE